MNIKTKYLGLELNNPVVVASSPFTSSARRIAQLAENGAGAVVLKSVFEEQIEGEAACLERYADYPEAADYLGGYVEQEYMRGHLQLIADAKKDTDIPIIASINCRDKGTWVDYAGSIESAGADAIELNIFILPADAAQKGSDIEKKYFEIVENVVSKVRIPVSVKLGMRFTNVLNISRELYYRGVKGVVMFNRFFEPDIDIENMRLQSVDSLSSGSELRNVLRTVGLCTPRLPELDVAVSSGVHTGADIIKSILAGAAAAQICTAIYLHGMPVIDRMKRELADWMEARGFSSTEQFRGSMSYREGRNDDLYQRVQYMKFMPRE